MTKSAFFIANLPHTFATLCLFAVPFVSRFTNFKIRSMDFFHFHSIHESSINNFSLNSMKWVCLRVMSMPFMRSVVQPARPGTFKINVFKIVSLFQKNCYFISIFLKFSCENQDSEVIKGYIALLKVYLTSKRLFNLQRESCSSGDRSKDPKT